MDLGQANFESLNMDLNGINVKSVTKTYPTQSSVALLTSSSSGKLKFSFLIDKYFIYFVLWFSFLDSEESLSSNEPEKKYIPKISKNIDSNNIKKHNLVQKLIVIPEICSQCSKKLVKHIVLNFICLIINLCATFQSKI